ncbi:hypothetical protein [Bilophila wadsworthia]|jgi:hypothetical protein|uniref:hypothetical protein n=1 Tax=Bilophila wadsworthia TaxID=35833 RepID=UPI0020510ADF|nr:hypothetical protein [Bilophila wadsworthia]DAT61749.1 MAG TPA: PGDYG protein [Caudoviricetes sp.]
MQKYRKKPVVIEAVQWWRDGHGNNNFAEVEALNGGSCRELLVNEDGDLIIFTLEGQLLASPGDYIIRGVKRELYPCKPDIFDATYEKVDE